MTFFKTLDEDQLNLLKCGGLVVTLTALASPFVNIFALGLVLIFNRVICSVFWRFKNKSRFKKGKYVCEYRNKRIDKIFGTVFRLINFFLIVPIYLSSAFLDLDSDLAFFLTICATFIISYLYQFSIKAPIGAFYASDPNQTITRRDPFEKSFFDSDPYRYDPMYSSHPNNIYNSTRD